MIRVVINIIIFSIFCFIVLRIFLLNFKKATQKTDKRYKIVFDCMGWGSLICAILTFLVTALYVYFRNPSNWPIAVIMGVVFGLTGGIFIGLFLGIITGHIIKAVKNKD